VCELDPNFWPWPYGSAHNPPIVKLERTSKNAGPRFPRRSYAFCQYAPSAELLVDP
jgi:hypothetical protein